MKLKELIDTLTDLNNQLSDDTEVILDTTAWCFKISRVKVNSLTFHNGNGTSDTMTSVHLMSNEDWSKYEGGKG
jgi:hypothetical protein